MKHWTIKKRIIIGFAVVLGLFSLVAATTFFLLKQVKGHQEDLTGDALPGITVSGQVKYLVCEIELSILRHITTKSSEEKKAFQADIDAKAAEIQKDFDEYQKTISRTEDREQYNRVMAVRDSFVKARGQVLELSLAGKESEAMELTRTTLRPAYASYLKECEGLYDENAKFGTTAAAASHKAMMLTNTLTLTLTSVGILLGTAFGFIIVGGVNRVLNSVTTSLSDGSTQVASAAGQVSSASQTLAEGASEQAASLEETSSSLEEMASMTKRNSENAQKASDLAKQAREAADRGAGDMQTMSAAMEAIKVSSDDIAKIIKTIDEIAFQTNILALNAAVEAARAGEAGMGFAVVADEVRNLAQRSAQAAKETAAKIEGAITKTGQGVEISGKVVQTLNDIVAKVRQVDELVAEVAGASREQTQGIGQINAAVTQMDKVTQSNAASAEESASAAEELNAQAETMKESVRELQRLVGGADLAHASTPSTPESRTKPAASKIIHARSATPVAAKARENGHSTVPALATAGRQSEIPMEGDFKDF